MRLIFVHGACVRDGDWWWHRMVEPLAAAGVRSRAVALPSCRGDVGSAVGDFYDDVAAVRVVLDEDDEPAVLLGHSYGGAVITDAGAGHPAVRRVVYLASVMPDVGESQATVVGDGPAPWLDPGSDGTIGVLPESVRELFVQDCDGPTQDAAVERLTRQSIVVFGQPVRGVAWREVPSTYVVCLEDLATPAGVQRERGGRAGEVVEIGAGHHPFLSRPGEFAELLLGVMGVR
ncbi:alpha/beta hydrolase [Cryptosporangium phraense]|uniref:Alpha/beta hydrolase n=1 Tax=Cryptosporangium phraense TaxID=2593070 RepID=A0A545AMA5_9ACTN|nr:alpha/beta hydrolase [Cryptosporangium phraense]TQS42464.1 alpha/beta hydrolase [Cryptosporangium phraense]